MSSGNLCFFTMLAALIAFPAVRTLDVRQSETLIRDSPNSEIHPSVVLPVQSKNPKDLGPGKLLVATRGLADPNFAQTVILLVHYDSESVIGLMLNRRTHIPISRVFSQLATAKDLSDPVYAGGPVETPTAFALLRSKDKLEDAEHVFDSVYWISKKTVFEKTISSHPVPGDFHVYLGYSGWTPAQLRTEIRLGGWFIFTADAESVFNANPDSLWRQMIKKTELQMAAAPLRRHTESPPSQPCPIGGRNASSNQPALAAAYFNHREYNHAGF